MIITSVSLEGRIVISISPVGLKTNGLLESEKEFIGVNTNASNFESIIGPPAEAE